MVWPVSQRRNPGGKSAFCLLVGFPWMLRGDTMCNLTVGDVSLGNQRGHSLLGENQRRQRKGCPELVMVTDKVLAELLMLFRRVERVTAFFSEIC